MVLYETDVLDEQYSFDDLFNYLGECLMTLYTGKTLHVRGATYHKKAKCYFIDTMGGEQIKCKKSAVVFIEKVGGAV